MFEYEAVRTAQSFVYEIKGDSAAILRCFSRDTKAEIPERIEGCPVTELGAYTFSAYFEEGKMEEKLRTGDVKLHVPEFLKAGPGQTEEISLPPALCGERLEEIVLPSTVRRVGRYCFYNCGNLRRMEFHGGLSDWGSGAFTGCHRVSSLRVYADADKRSHLKDVLDELREELEVEYCIKGRMGLKTTGGHDMKADMWKAARLIFPEFYEEGVENTPARILETHVHGSGILYRNCFQGRVFDFSQYDALFPHAKAWESKELVLRMAINRLRFPEGLTQKAQKQYADYLAEHLAEAGKWLLGQRDLESVRFLLDLMEKQGSQTKDDANTVEESLLEEASRLQYTEAVGFFMDYLAEKRESRPVRRRRLEL